MKTGDAEKAPWFNLQSDNGHVVGASTGTGKFPVAMGLPLHSSNNVGFKQDRQLHQVNGWSAPHDDVWVQVRGGNVLQEGVLLAW